MHGSPKAPSPHKCSVRAWHDGSRCDNPSTTGTPWQVCWQHLQEIRAYVQERDHQRAATLGAAREAEWAAQRERKRRLRNDNQAVVYYLQMPGDLIKIGTTRNLRQRLNSLTVRDHDVLAVEPGGPEVESERHRQFAHLRWRDTERFRDDPALRSHIELVLVEHGRPQVNRHGQGVTYIK